MNDSPGGRPPKKKGRVGRGLAVGIPVFIFSLMAMIAIGGLVAVVAVFAAFSQDLPPTSDLQNLEFISESVVYDRTGQVQLANFNAGEDREPVSYEQIPPVLIDAVTSTEDRSFWTNTGVDPIGIGSAFLDTLRGRERGASTVTQQLVRQRLLDPELVRDPGRGVERKLKEIIQSVRVTQAFPGEEGKRQIITAYLNQNYYGNGLYGIKAAARGYFGVEDLNDLTLSQVALLAGLPQSPSSYDLVRNASVADDGTLFVPNNERIPIVYRRNFILRQMAEDPSRMVLTEGSVTPEELLAAIDDDIILAPQESVQQEWIAPHFIWALREELATKLCGPEAETCPELERGGLRITSTLDVGLQDTAEKWVDAAVWLPKEADPQAYAEEIGVPYERWMRKLENLDVNNGAMIAMDYQTGEIVAYVGSAGYYREDDSTPQFQPQFDVLGDGWRQPGSAFKPFNFVTGINDGTMTAASMFMDVTTTFDNSSGYTPKNFDLLERGPMRMRDAIKMSLNVPAVKAQVINGVTHVFDQAKRFGMEFQTEAPSAGLSLTLGTEVTHPRDVAVSYGTLANGGVNVGYTHILRVDTTDGEELVPEHVPTPVDQPISPQAAYVMTDILKSNTDPRQNEIWGQFNLQGPGGRRPAALKTGTSQDANDLVAFGYIAPPEVANRAAGQYALVVGAWAGNSDGSPALTPENPVLSTDVAAPMWHGFLQEATGNWPVQDFARPGGIVEADVDAWSGGRPTQFTTQTVREVFIDGTAPGDDTTKVGMQVVPNPNAPADAPESSSLRWLLWADGCGTPETRGFLALEGVEAGHPDWQRANLDWIARAKQGIGVAGGPDPNVKTETSYIFNRGWRPYGRSWGAPFPPTESCTAIPSPSPSLSPSPEVTLTPSPEPTIEITPEPTLPPQPTPQPTEPPQPTPQPTEPPQPTPEPTEQPPDPTPAPSAEP
jgi:penicillin-binding protein 1A